MSAAVLIIAAGVAAIVLTSDDGAESGTVEWPPTPATGPGSNSLGPLNAPVVVEWPPTPATGPGSNSLGPLNAPVVVEWPTPTEGPGSTSLAPTGPGTATAIEVVDVVDQPTPTTGAGVAGHHRPM